MAHPLPVKAKAMALVLAGHSSKSVSNELGVPRTTVRRWKREVIAMFAPELREVRRALQRQGLDFRTKRPPKKGVHTPGLPD